MIEYNTRKFGPDPNNWRSGPDHYQVVDNVPDTSGLFEPIVPILRNYFRLMIEIFGPLIFVLELLFSQYPPAFIINLLIVSLALPILVYRLRYLLESLQGVGRRLHNIRRNIVEDSQIWRNHPNLYEVFDRICECIDPILELGNKLANLVRNALRFIEDYGSNQNKQNQQQQPHQQQPQEEQEEEPLGSLYKRFFNL